MQYSGSAIRDCSGDSEPQSGPVCSGGRLPLASCRLDIATAALNSAKGVQHEHSEGGAGPDSISDIARSNPGDVLAIAAFQASLRELPITLPAAAPLVSSEGRQRKYLDVGQSVA